MKGYIILPKGTCYLKFFSFYMPLFLIIFNFKIPFIYNSVVLALAISLVLNFRFIVGFRLNKKLFYIPFIYCSLFFLIVIQAVFSETKDFSRSASIISNLFVYFSLMILFLPSLNGSYSKAISLHDLCRAIFYIFLLQSLIIFLAAFSSEFHSLVKIFQLPEDAERSLSYGGVRGLALSGAQFFPLSAAFAVAQLFIGYLIVSSESKRFMYTIGLFFIAIAGISAGRTSLIGFSFTLIYILFFCITDRKLRIHFYKVILLSMLLVFVLANTLNLSGKITGYIESFSIFAFEFIYSYLETGSFNTKSTDILSKMYWTLEPYRYIFGYGYYSNQDGSTFLSTDAGYMRNILFFGLFGTLFIIFSNLSLLFILIKKRTESSYRLFIFLFFLLVFFLHYKGDVLLHLVSVQTFIYLLAYTLFIRSNNEI